MIIIAGSTVATTEIIIEATAIIVGMIVLAIGAIAAIAITAAAGLNGAIIAEFVSAVKP